MMWEHMQRVGYQGWLCRSTTAYNLKEFKLAGAIQRWESKRTDLVIFDENLPLQTGCGGKNNLSEKRLYVHLFKDASSKSQVH